MRSNNVATMLIGMTRRVTALIREASGGDHPPRGAITRWAEKVGTSASNVNRWRGGGVPDPARWPAIADALGIDHDHFVALVDDDAKGATDIEVLFGEEIGKLDERIAELGPFRIDYLIDDSNPDEASTEDREHDAELGLLHRRRTFMTRRLAELDANRRADDRIAAIEARLNQLAAAPTNADLDRKLDALIAAVHDLGASVAELHAVEHDAPAPQKRSAGSRR